MSSELAPPLVSPVPQPSALLRLVSDERLLEHVRTGSERAFDVLYDRHHRSLLAFCRHMLGSHHEAEDAVQYTFFAAYREIMHSDKPIAPRPWLFAIARNRCVSMLRARRERPVEKVPESPTEHLAAEVDRREDLRSLLTDLARLPDDERAALLLTELGGVSHAEIGRILSCRRERVKRLVFQARSSLLDDRIVRDASCDEIREQLACLSGAALRRTVLRRHLRECPGCRDFRDAVRRQRRVLAAVVPVAPGLALKQAAFGAAAGVGGGSAGPALVSGTLGGLVARALIAVAITGAGTVAVNATGDSVAPGDGAAAAPELVGRPSAPDPVGLSAPPTAVDRRPSVPGELAAPPPRAGETPERDPVSSNPDDASVRPGGAAPSQAPPLDDGAGPAATPAAPTEAAAPGSELLPLGKARGRRLTPPGHPQPRRAQGLTPPGQAQTRRAEGPPPRGHRFPSPGHGPPARARDVPSHGAGRADPRTAPPAAHGSAPKGGLDDRRASPTRPRPHASTPARPPAPAGRELAPATGSPAARPAPESQTPHAEAQLMAPAATKQSTSVPSRTR